MRLNLLHLDGALLAQDGFLRSCGDDARPLDVRQEGGHVRLWGRTADLDKLKDRLRAQFANDEDGARLCFMGSGDFHHVSALLIEAAAERCGEAFTVIHFDNHPDWVRYQGGLHCGSWVHRALELTSVQKIITVGVCSSDLRNPDLKGANLTPMSAGKLEIFPYAHAPSRVRRAYGQGAGFRQVGNRLHWQTMEAEGEAAFLARLLSRIGTKAVYITVDKDVLSTDDAETNWDQGRVRLPWLLDAIRAIGAAHKIIGADVTGDYSPPTYSGSIWRRFAANVEIRMDQPRRSLTLQQAANLNSAANNALLDVFSEVMA